MSVNVREQTSSLTSSCATRKFSTVSEIYHTWSLDHQCHGKDVTRFSEKPYMVIGSSVSWKAWDKDFLNGHNYLMTNDGKYHENIAT